MRTASGPPRLTYITLHRTDSWQGASTHVRAMVKELARLGWVIELQAPSRRRGWPARALEQLLLQVRAVLRSPRPDIVYLRSHPLSPIAALMCRATGLPWVEEVNGTLEDTFQAHPWTRWLAPLLVPAARWSLARAACVLPVDEGLAAWVRRETTPRRVEVVPNGVDPSVFRPEATDDSHESDMAYAVYAGALVPWEGIDALLSAVEAPEWPQDLQLVIAGEGPLRSCVEDSGERVRYAGPLPHEAIPALLAGARLGISPYEKPTWGASPIKLYEMMASGIPIVGSDSPGQSLVVEQADCGRLFPAGSGRALAASVRELHDAPESERRRLGQNGRRAAVNQHSWAKRAQMVDAVLRDVVGDRGRRQGRHVG